MSEISTMTLDETLQLLQISQENLTELLSACGWGDLTQFTEEQSEMLIAVNEGHVNHDWPYLESYLRNVAHRKGLTPEQFDEMAAAITQAGGTLFDYREQFEALCQQVIDGASPQDIVTPQDKVSDSQIKDVADSLTPVMSGKAIFDLVEGFGKANARQLCDKIEGFAALSQQDQQRLEEIYIQSYRGEVFAILQSDEFKKRVDISVSGGVTEEEQKKQFTSLLFGDQIPAKLLSGSSS